MTCILRTTTPRPHVLHIASSYPDPIGSDTSASSLLLECSEGFEHTVFSFKRRGWYSAPTHIPFSDQAGHGHEAIAYGAPGKGVLFKHSLDKLVDLIFARISQRGLQPVILHGHKLTMDGYIAWRLSQRLKIPYCLSLQSNTDLKILSARPDMRGVFKQIWHSAKLCFAFAPVAEHAISSLLGNRPERCIYLPCPTMADAIVRPGITPPDGPKTIVTAFHLQHAKNKNVLRLMKAVRKARRQVPNIQLKIVGGGDAASFQKVSDAAHSICPGQIKMVGALPQAGMQACFNQATGFALLSLRESFGMVYSEALLAGLPILYSKGRAIDGYFEEGDFSLTADPLDSDYIARKLVTLCQEEASMKSRLKDAQDAGVLDILQRDHIAATYSDALRNCLNPQVISV